MMEPSSKSLSSSQSSWDDRPGQESSQRETDDESSLANQTQQQMDQHDVQSDNDHHDDISDRPLSRGGEDRRMKICRVCGDKALSVNFNVVTCESCKAFFRRNALKPKAFRCPFSGVCEINIVSRKFCKKCRLRKCFEVGMMKEWIMSDEARLKKRELIDINREKRRTVIMATAAKHGMDASETDKLESDETCLDNGKGQLSSGFATDEGYLSSERSGDEMSSNEFVANIDPVITVSRSSLIDFAVQCRCPYKDLGAIIDDFIERQAATRHQQNREAVHRHAASSAWSQSKRIPAICDCGLCANYRSKVPNLIGGANFGGQIQLPTMNAEAMTKLDETNGKSANMLSFLAPSFGKYYQAVEFPTIKPTPVANHGVSTVPAPMNPVSQLSPWTQAVSIMPSIPLESISNNNELINTFSSTNCPNMFSCPLPIKLSMSAPQLQTQQSQIDDLPHLININEEYAKLSAAAQQIHAVSEMNLKNSNKIGFVGGSQMSLNFGEPSNINQISADTNSITGTIMPTVETGLSVLNYAVAGKLSKLPYSMLPRLQELVDAKKFLINNHGNGEKNVISDGPEEFFKHITAFNQLLENDRIILMNSNRVELEILRRVIFYDTVIKGSMEDGNKMGIISKKDMEICEKYVKLIPKIWRHDDCIMLSMMAIAAFNTCGCGQLLCKNIVDTQREFYLTLLRKYLECVYKANEVEAAQQALLDILCEMRFEKLSAIAVSTITARRE